jgi:hypothetical protein
MSKSAGHYLQAVSTTIRPFRARHRQSAGDRLRARSIGGRSPARLKSAGHYLQASLPTARREHHDSTLRARHRSSSISALGGFCASPHTAAAVTLTYSSYNFESIRSQAEPLHLPWTQHRRYSDLLFLASLVASLLFCSFVIFKFSTTSQRSSFTHSVLQPSQAHH